MHRCGIGYRWSLRGRHCSRPRAAARYPLHLMAGRRLDPCPGVTYSTAPTGGVRLDTAGRHHEVRPLTPESRVSCREVVVPAVPATRSVQDVDIAYEHVESSTPRLQTEVDVIAVEAR